MVKPRQCLSLPDSHLVIWLLPTRSHLPWLFFGSTSEASYRNLYRPPFHENSTSLVLVQMLKGIRIGGNQLTVSLYECFTSIQALGVFLAPRETPDGFLSALGWPFTQNPSFRTDLCTAWHPHNATFWARIKAQERDLFGVVENRGDHRKIPSFSNRDFQTSTYDRYSSAHPNRIRIISHASMEYTANARPTRRLFEPGMQNLRAQPLNFTLSASERHFWDSPSLNEKKFTDFLDALDKTVVSGKIHNILHSHATRPT
ncbi:uncharacterized protein BDR25DRAFT_348796 [Lindgomyces ingoldianus]|uniref:Uncharacterized protein n=1 Tax=Lindgomyces ingoldianus TaxID=673940 RepID=A0ACB6RC69_9PLEO|nr:uncharacterized protein BDR25DRAFT_348796 [Lindgomyces ingoldianus]KAF2476864.1 hypothetical protein BDR25DRAFT_348796 [Lindgomyces ingoldianus]